MSVTVRFDQFRKSASKQRGVCTHPTTPNRTHGMILKHTDNTEQLG